jgi:hypothetical protein
MVWSSPLLYYCMKIVWINITFVFPFWNGVEPSPPLLRPLLGYCTSGGWWMFMTVEQSVECLAGQTEILGENLPQCLFIHHKSHITLPGLEFGPPRWTCCTTIKNSVASVRKRTIQPEQQPLVSEVSANFFADRGCCGVGIPTVNTRLWMVCSFIDTLCKYEAWTQAVYLQSVSIKAHTIHSATWSAWRIRTAVFSAF